MHVREERLKNRRLLNMVLTMAQEAELLLSCLCGCNGEILFGITREILVCLTYVTCMATVSIFKKLAHRESI